MRQFYLTALLMVSTAISVPVTPIVNPANEYSRLWIVENPPKTWVVEATPAFRTTLGNFFTSSRLISKTSNQIKVECHRYVYNNDSGTELRRTSYISISKPGMLMWQEDIRGLANPKNKAAWASALSMICDLEAPSARRQIIPFSGSQYKIPEMPGFIAERTIVNYGYDGKNSIKLLKVNK